MNKRKLAELNYRRFCGREGSQYIATEFALFQILRVIKTFKTTTILELGLGIGAIADTVLQYSRGLGYDLSYTGTESNDFCLHALKKNVRDFSRLEIFSSLKEVGPEKKFDLIIVDGLDDQLEAIARYSNSRTIVFIEGDRSKQADLLMKVFPKAKQVNIISLRRNKEYSPGSPDFFVGGGRLIFLNPTLKMSAFYWKERTITFIKRYLRKIV